MKAGILGVGSALPEHVVTNADLVARLDTSDEWIRRRTGIERRHWLNGDGPLGGLAAQASRQALADAGRDAAELDLVLVATTTPDRITPGLAPELARAVGATHVAAVDVNAACAGFVYALDHAAALIESGRARLVLVCAAEALSRITDAADRGTAVLFGDGAGAVVLGAGAFDMGVGRFVLGSDGDRSEMLFAERDPGTIQMRGPEVYRHAVLRMTQATRTALDAAHLTSADLDLLVAHQANRRIVEAVAQELGVESDRVVYDMQRVANTSAASIPLALHQAERDERLRPGMTVGLAAFGAGFVWGAGVVRWKERARVCA